MREGVSGSVMRRSIGKIVHATQGSTGSKYIRPYFDAMILNDIKAEHLIAFDAWLESKKLSERTRRTIFATLIKTFHHAVENGVDSKVTDAARERTQVGQAQESSTHTQSRLGCCGTR